MTPAASLTPTGHPAALVLFDRLQQPVWVFDIDHARVHWANGAALAIWDAASLSELLARDMSTDMSESVWHRLRQFQRDFRTHDARFSDVWTLYPRGVPRTLRVQYSGLWLPDGRMAMLCEGLGDQPGDPDTLRSAAALLHTPMMITLVDDGGQVLYRNPAARDAVADPTARLNQHFAVAEDHLRLQAQLQRDGHGRLLARVATGRGERWHEISASRCRDAATGIEATLYSEVDISELKRTEARAHYLSLHDTLTGLPNRHFVVQGFQQRLDEVRRLRHEAALVFIDLDHFKHVNDSLGHAVGDQLLVQMAERLRGELRDDDLVARLGGDEFLVLAAAPDIAPYVESLGHRILDAMSRAVQLGGAALREVRVTPSVGVCLFPRDGDDIDMLMRHADLAMYRAKDNGRNCVAFYSPEMNTAAQTRLSLENDLRIALDRGEFEVFYQPRLEVATGRVVGAEALVRWHHPAQGLLGPAIFIPVCEDSGLIGALGAWVLGQAARQQLVWRQGGWDLSVSVNLSPRQFKNPTLLASLQEIVERAGCDPRRLELEITESVLMGNDADTLRVLNALRDVGFGIVIDDFGTGYSNLAYLRHYPIDGLKIDRSFISELGEATAITGLIISMSRMLGLRVVAEGVETSAQLDWLHIRGCEEYQGFLASPPVQVQRFEELLRQANGDPREE